MKLSAIAKEYALEHLARVAFPGLSVKTDTTAGALLTIQSRITVRFPLLSDPESESLMAGSLQAHSLLGATTETLPVFVPEGALISNDGEILFPYDIVTPTFILLSRMEEMRATQLDAQLRFRFEESLTHHYHCIDFPLVDEYALLLRKTVCERFPELIIKQRKTSVVPTHDIDFLCRFSGWFSTWKSMIGGDLLRDRDWKQFRSSLQQYRHFKALPLEDPMMLGIRRLIDASVKKGLTSEFYFKGLHKGEKDCTYEIDSMAVAEAVRWIREAGMVAGMHGSMESYRQPERFGEEQLRVTAAIGEQAVRGRQHFLRFFAPRTVAIWQRHGMLADSTLGYSEREGFRCGTCHPFRLYDLENDKPSGVIERPLIVMDATLFRNFAGQLDAAYGKVVELYQNCMKAEGDFVILWHNSSMYRTLEPWFQQVYLRFLEQLN